MNSETRSRADYLRLRYAQCWEDADVLLEALDIQPHHTCFAIASAGDNALAMLSRGPRRLIAVDLNPAQLASVELRVAAYRELEHGELLTLVGSRPGSDRMALYRRCRSLLSSDSRRFWDDREQAIARGIGSAGKFERYLAVFRERVLPLIHRRNVVDTLFAPRPLEGRREFFENTWNSRCWRGTSRIFFSRFVMGRVGRDPSFYDYVEGCVADRILARARYALTELDPSENPYLQWILYGHHTTALPFALRPENYDAIRANLDRLEWREQSLEEFLESDDARGLHAYNLSDVFEYMSQESYHRILHRIIETAAGGARLAYWNLLVSRQRPETMESRITPLSIAANLHQRDKAFFYSAFVVEKVAGT
ncbi:MAG: DUF3419 family protein [Gemmatimonadetes bacterium]|nr:DUF3419 family protein [Gemmatimonadota bacterium]